MTYTVYPHDQDGRRGEPMSVYAANDPHALWDARMMLAPDEVGEVWQTDRLVGWIGGAPNPVQALPHRELPRPIDLVTASTSAISIHRRQQPTRIRVRPRLSASTILDRPASPRPPPSPQASPRTSRAQT